MKINHKLVVFSLIIITAVSAISISAASAKGWLRGGYNLNPEQQVDRQTQMFEHQADMLGITVDQVKDYWSQGKNIREIAEELGIDEQAMQQKMEQNRQEQLQSRLQILVDQGVITQAQADSRLESMSERGFGAGKLGRKPDMGRGHNGNQCPFALENE